MSGWGKKPIEDKTKKSAPVAPPMPPQKKPEPPKPPVAKKPAEPPKEPAEKPEKKKEGKGGASTFNLEIFNRFRKFSGGDPEMNKLWVSKDFIISTKPQVKSLLYNPKDSLYKNEFGISNLQNFINLLSTFDEIEMNFDMPHILFRSKNSILTYKSASKESFKQKIDSNTLAFDLHQISKKMIADEQYFKFRLDHETLGKIIKIGNNISYSSQNPSMVTIVKDSDDDKVLLQIHNPDSENTYNVMLEGENLSKISDFKQSLNIVNLLDGDWDVYLFEGGVEHAGQTIPIVWTFLVDTNGEYEMLLVFKNKQD